jgi:hypothetical protein
MVIDVLKYMTNMSNRKKGMRKGGPLRQKTLKTVRNRSMISHPPQIDSYLIVHGVRLRFTATNNFNGTITFQNLLDCIDVATSATALSNLFHVVKIRKVEVWSIAQVGTPVSCSVSFSNNSNAGQFGDSKFHTDTSMGIEPAHVMAVPQRNSPASLFQGASNTEAFILDAPAGSVIDVELTYKQKNATQVSTQNVGVALTAGEVYFRGLDGLASASSDLLPPANVNVA